MSTGLIPVIKQAATEAMNNMQMCDLRYGTVVSVSPIKVEVTNQFTIPSALLVVPQHLTNYSVPITINGSTKLIDDPAATEKVEPHEHEISGTTTITIRNALKVGDKVALLRKQGGQSYFILDRV